MTNKLPIVGTKYLDKKTGEILTLQSIQTIKNHRWYHFETDYGVAIAASAHQFKNHYKELPKDNSNQIEDDRFTDVGKTIEEVKTGTTSTLTFGENKLPWKDVSELPEKSIDFKAMISEARYHLKEIRTKTTGKPANIPASVEWLINTVESMLSRQDELEERIKKLENER